ncbi:hypothetical protein CFI00_07100 [Nocardioides sp. S5]|nr:hypothetical protein CFI00_07100 [Nocardioides sp. S5]
MARWLGGIADRHAFEEMDLASFRPFSKWVVEIRHADRIPEPLQRAVRTAASGKPGPVVVSLPLDVLQTPVSDDVNPLTTRCRSTTESWPGSSPSTTR